MLPSSQLELPSGPEASSHEHSGSDEKKQGFQNISPVPQGAGVEMGVLSKDDTEIALTFPMTMDFTEEINAIVCNLQLTRELNFEELTTRN